MLLLKTLVLLALLWLVAIGWRHRRDRSPGSYIGPRFASPIDKPRCRVCAGTRRDDALDPGSPSAAARAQGEGSGEGGAASTAAVPDAPARVADTAPAPMSEDAAAAGTRDTAADTTDPEGSRGRIPPPSSPDSPTPATHPPPTPSGGRDGTLFVPPGYRDDLKKIKGIGKVMEGKLNALGVTSFAQLAAFRQADIDRVDATLESFKGRIERDRWVEQAAELARRSGKD